MRGGVRWGRKGANKKWRERGQDGGGELSEGSAPAPPLRSPPEAPGEGRGSPHVLAPPLPPLPALPVPHPSPQIPPKIPGAAPNPPRNNPRAPPQTSPKPPEFAPNPPDEEWGGALSEEEEEGAEPPGGWTPPPPEIRRLFEAIARAPAACRSGTFRCPRRLPTPEPPSLPELPGDPGASPAHPPPRGKVTGGKNGDFGEKNGDFGEKTRKFWVVRAPF
ncbi:uncharacterized protein LOC135288564 [Passer domesticus]|uniref:uncharacterized protein LOC135288564 n=1 Tax=Passer domesticus TaxID=48849 RepID=UPI0030FF22C3